MRHVSQQNIRAAFLAVLLAVSPACTGAAQTKFSQTKDSAPATNVAAALQEVAAQAAVMFTGSVVQVQPDQEGGACVTFAVEHGIRGTFPGAGYAVRVSAWAGGADRFYPGERALFLMTAPSASGYSAPVMGERGIVPLTGDALVGNLDLRWIAVDVLRGTPSDGSGSSEAAAHVASASLPRAQVASAASPASSAEPSAEISPNTLTLPDVHAIDRDLVIDLLRSQASSNGRPQS